MRRRFVGRTCDLQDCTSFGYEFEIMRKKDGFFYIVATYNTRWQGSRDKVEKIYPNRFPTMAEAISMARLLLCGCRNDPYSFEYEFDFNWKKYKSGHLVF